MKRRAPLVLAAALVGGCSVLTDLTGLSTAAAPDGGSPPVDASGEAIAPLVDGGEAGADAEVPLGPPKWRKASTTGAPGRHSASIAFDENRQRIVLFGGYAKGSGLGDTWEWDGTTWSERTVPTTPGARRGHKLVSDTVRKIVFLYGGMRGDTSDQWSWDGLRWRELPSTTHATSFQITTTAYDSDRGVVVVFGGNHFPTTGPFVTLDETWEWNGTDWARRMPAKSPSARRGHAMAYDASRKRVVLFGGKAGTALADTWEWDGTSWTEREPITIPKARGGACMAYDPRRKLVVMHGGMDSANFSETWLWDGTDWKLGPSGAPAVRSCAMAWDPARKAIVMFSGALDAPNDGPPLGETWSFE